MTRTLAGRVAKRAIPAVPLSAPVAFTIAGPPRTKKTSGNIMNRGKRRIVKPSDAWLAFRDLAVRQIRDQMRAGGPAGFARAAGMPASPFPINAPVNVRATFYLDADRLCDVQGLYESLADVLKVDKGRGAGVLLDDNRRIIVSWDGSRVEVDRARPRVEVLIEPAV